MKLSKRLLSIGICFMMVASLFAGITLPAYAKEYDEEILGNNESFNIDDFDYITNGNKIYLTKYKGTAENLVIPSKYELSDYNYNVRLTPNCNSFFMKNETLKTISFGDGVTSEVTNMTDMFNYCTNLTSVVGLDTSHSTTFHNMFYRCFKLTNVDTSHFNTSNVTDMECMFSRCYDLPQVDLSGFDTSKVTNMNGMFSNCQNLTDVDVSGFNTSNVEGKGFSNMFYGCQRVKELDVSNWSTAKATNINALFCYCQEIDKLDLSNWDLSNVTWGTNVILGCEDLIEIKTPLNLYTDIELPATFTREDDETVTYTNLPKEQITSFTITKQRPADSNVISIDYDNGTAVVRDRVADDVSQVPLSVIEEGDTYRMYDPNRGEHFYTKNSAEVIALTLLGWNYEEESNYTSVDARGDNSNAVYRLYNPNDGGMHFYTDNVMEARSLIKTGWSYEGISFYTYDKNSMEGIAQFRLYNPNSPNGEHNWTTSEAERNMLTSLGWKDEGVCWNVIEPNDYAQTGIVGTFRYIDPDIQELVCTYTFNSNGTGKYDIAGEVLNFTYTTDGSTLTIMFEGQQVPMVVEYTVDANALVIIDGTGSEIVYTRI
ncbi:MAG: BspA family leucine-rich repeat surface protein [Lachnospiraceae bacterium]|nr:BspA family leucine-rich repeat surface protein [Lachnospiraceae bacterium]